MCSQWRSRKCKDFKGVETQMDETVLLCDVPGGRRPKSAVDFDEGCAKKLSTTYDNVQFHTTSRRMPYSLVRLDQAWVLSGNLNHLNLLESLNSEQDTCARVAAAVFFGVFQVWKMQRSSRRLLSGTKSSNSTEQ